MKCMCVSVTVCLYIHTYIQLVLQIRDWLWENLPVMHKDNYLEKRTDLYTIASLTLTKPYFAPL